MCKNWPDFPIVINGATGGLIGNTVMICGGYSAHHKTHHNDCYSLTSQKATLATHMSVARDDAASIVLDDNTLWVTGGTNGSNLHNWLSSTDYVTMSGTLPGPDLPMTLAQHAMVAINSSSSMVIGGRHRGLGSSRTSTFFYDHIEGKWNNGPSLSQKRCGHAAGIITDKVTNEQFVAVTGGSYYAGKYKYVYLDSTEILQDGKWVQGKMNDNICYFINS